MEEQLFNKIKDNLLSLDPIYFCYKYLTLDGKKFTVSGGGYAPFGDIYRAIGIKALEKNSKPIVILKSRQVGLTTTAAALEMYFMGNGYFGANGNPPIRVIHAFPQLDLANSYAKTKFNAMLNGSMMTEPVTPENKKNKRKPYIQTLFEPNSPQSNEFHPFVNGNHIWIESVGLDGSRLMGKTADGIFFDEVQKMPATAIANSVKILLKSQYGAEGSGFQVYFGTPLLKGSFFWDLWQASSQQYYHLGCEKCAQHFPLYTPNSNEWENIWLYEFIVRCTHCGHEQDKKAAAERGKWVALKDPNNSKFIGFHINQLYMPEFSKERILAEKPGNSPINTERAYQNEVLGEFYQGDATSITPDQVRDKCGIPEKKFRQHILPNDNLITFLGIDIGDKSDLESLIDNNKRVQGQSYSVAVVLSLTGAQQLTVEFCTKFKRNDVQSKKSLIEEIMKKYSIKLGVCDIGHSNDLNEILQTQLGGKFLSSRSSGRMNNHIKYDDEVFPKIITFDRDHYIGEVYEWLRNGKIRIPLGSYEQVSWFIQHLCGLEIKPTMSRSGDAMPHYVKTSQASDGFFALMNAYIAYKFHITNGFKDFSNTSIDKKDRVNPYGILGGRAKF